MGSFLDKAVNPSDITALFELIMGRQIGNDPSYIESVTQGSVTLRDYAKGLLSSKEFQDQFIDDMAASGKVTKNDWNGNIFSSPWDYRSPTKLKKTDDRIKNILLISSCLGEVLGSTIKYYNENTNVEYYMIGTQGEEPLRSIENYDFQIVQLPIRGVAGTDLAFAALTQGDSEGYQQLFEASKAAIVNYFHQSMRWSEKYGILTFVMSFMVPQQNFVGKLFPRYDLSNPVYFVEKLNEFLCELTSRYKNAYFFDINEVGSSLGKRFSYEDHVWAFNHGSILGNYDAVIYNRTDRAEQIIPNSELYSSDSGTFLRTIYTEMCAMYRTARQIDSVKMVVVDLDDTMWNGTVGEVDDPSGMSSQEGWPRGFWEALLVLKKRGIILAIISKNDEDVVRNAWPHIVTPDLLKLEDFAVVKINWSLKSENMREILSATNLLPHSVVYIDDNPLQRQEVSNAFPDIRVLGGTPGTWRHILLWAPETQLATVTSESAKRSDMIKAQVKREEERGHLSPDDFLSGLGLKLNLFLVGSTSHPRFARVLELVNKTNQFNTTGVRWREEDIALAISNGLKIFAFNVSDKFTDYGLVGVFFIEGSSIAQFVMSCRVLGLGIERAGVSKMVDFMREHGAGGISAVLKETERNQPCRSVYKSIGFSYSDDLWRLPKDVEISAPSHVKIEVVLE